MHRDKDRSARDGAMAEKRQGRGANGARRWVGVERSGAPQARGGGTGTASVRVRPASCTRPGQAKSGAVTTTTGAA